MPTNQDTEARRDAAPPVTAGPERLVRSRSGRLVPESQLGGPPVPEAAKPMPSALKAALAVGGVVAVVGMLLIVLDTRDGGARESFEAFFRDFGYVVREVNGPGIER